MSLLPVPVDGKGLDWPRKVANAINGLLRTSAARETMPFQMLDAEPSDPVEGRAYFDTTTHKLRTFDGTTWVDAW